MVVHWRSVLYCESWRCLGNTPVFISRQAEDAGWKFPLAPWVSQSPPHIPPNTPPFFARWSRDQGLLKHSRCFSLRSLHTVRLGLLIQKRWVVCVCFVFCRMNITPGKAQMSSFNISPDDDSSSSSNSVEYPNCHPKKVPLSRYQRLYQLLFIKIHLLLCNKKINIYVHFFPKLQSIWWCGRWKSELPPQPRKEEIWSWICKCPYQRNYKENLPNKVEHIIRVKWDKI